MDNIRLGYINGSFTLDKPLTDELVTLINETFDYPRSTWEIEDDKTEIYSNYEENYNPHIALKELIDEVLKPNGYVLNGKVSIEEDSAYTERIFEWYIIVENNEVLVTNQQEQEEDRIVQLLNQADPPQRLKMISIFLRHKGYLKIASFLDSLE